jgi:hypothetical protein
MGRHKWDLDQLHAIAFADILA